MCGGCATLPPVPDPLAPHDVARLRADNPGPFTLTGTNTWVIGRDPCWIVDPGPALDEHVAAVLVEADGRGGAGGMARTPAPGTHADATAARRDASPGPPPVGASRPGAGGAAGAPPVGA